MSLLKLTLIFSAVQLLLGITTFLLFGLGLEGPRNLGYTRKRRQGSGAWIGCIWKARVWSALFTSRWVTVQRVPR